MNLIEIYIGEVTRRIPEKQREDIALELQSTIEDMLPDDYHEEDVKAVLEQLGNPVTLASGYHDKPMHLIGPKYFDVYVSLLKMLLPIVIVISLISTMGDFIIRDQNKAVLDIILHVMGIGIWRFIEIGIHVFFWVTFVFAILERTDKAKDHQPLTSKLKSWTPDDLKDITYIPKHKLISKFEVFGSLLWTAIWATLYFYADQLLGVYESGKDGLEFVMPALNQTVLFQYWPIIVLIIAMEIGFALYKLIKRKWSRGMAFFHAAQELISTIVFFIILLNPQVFNPDFIAYLSSLFQMTVEQLKTAVIGIAIFAFILTASISVFDSFRKARIR